MSQGALFDLPETHPDARPGLHWRGFWRGAQGDKLGREFRLFEGDTPTPIAFAHCGHPTALRPWHGTWTGRKFADVDAAKLDGVRAHSAGTLL